MPIFSDLNSITAAVKPLLTDEAAVYQSIYNIFNTRPGERLFLPEFGLDLDEELFSLMDDVSALTLLTKIIQAVERWEGRVRIDPSRSQVTPEPDTNTYSMYLVFSIKGNQDQKFELEGSFKQ